MNHNGMSLQKLQQALPQLGLRGRPRADVTGQHSSMFKLHGLVSVTFTNSLMFILPKCP